MDTMGHEIKLRNMSIYCEANPSAAFGHDLNLSQFTSVPIVISAKAERVRATFPRAPS